MGVGMSREYTLYIYVNIETERKKKKKEREREREGGREGGRGGGKRHRGKTCFVHICIYVIYIYISYIQYIYIYYDSVGFDGNCVGKPMGFTCFYQWLFLAVSFIQFDGFRMAVKDHPCHPNKN